MNAAKGGPGPRNSTRTTPAPPPWWTAADQAELDTLIHEYVRAAKAHDHCAACRRMGRGCPPLADAWEAIEEWIRGRRLLSRAAYLRAAQKISDLRNEAA